ALNEHVFVTMFEREDQAHAGVGFLGCGVLEGQRCACLQRHALAAERYRDVGGFADIPLAAALRVPHVLKREPIRAVKTYRDLKVAAADGPDTARDIVTDVRLIV